LVSLHLLVLTLLLTAQSTTPTGFITLRYASVHLDAKRLTKGASLLHAPRCC
jgi:hypothetical protein